MVEGIRYVQDESPMLHVDCDHIVLFDGKRKRIFVRVERLETFRI